MFYIIIYRNNYIQYIYIIVYNIYMICIVYYRLHLFIIVYVDVVCVLLCCVVLFSWLDTLSVSQEQATDIAANLVKRTLNADSATPHAKARKLAEALIKEEADDAVDEEQELQDAEDDTRQDMAIDRSLAASSSVIVPGKKTAKAKSANKKLKHGHADSSKAEEKPEDCGPRPKLSSLPNLDGKEGVKLASSMTSIWKDTLTKFRDGGLTDKDCLRIVQKFEGKKGAYLQKGMLDFVERCVAYKAEAVALSKFVVAYTQVKENADRKKAEAFNEALASIKASEAFDYIPQIIRVFSMTLQAKLDLMNDKPLASILKMSSAQFIGVGLTEENICEQQQNVWKQALVDLFLQAERTKVTLQVVQERLGILLGPVCTSDMAREHLSPNVLNTLKVVYAVALPTQSSLNVVAEAVRTLEQAGKNAVFRALKVLPLGSSLVDAAKVFSEDTALVETIVANVMTCTEKVANIGVDCIKDVRETNGMVEFWGRTHAVLMEVDGLLVGVKGGLKSESLTKSVEEQLGARTGQIFEAFNAKCAIIVGMVVQLWCSTFVAMQAIICNGVTVAAQLSVVPCLFTCT
jgi:hypothetical protein